MPAGCVTEKYTLFFNGSFSLLTNHPFWNIFPCEKRHCFPESLSCTEVTYNVKTKDLSQISGEACTCWEHVKLPVVMPCKNFADVQVAPQKQPEAIQQTTTSRETRKTKGHLHVEDILTHSAPVSLAPEISKDPATLLDFILASQSVVFN